MTIPTYRHALIVGAGRGLSASFARRLHKEGIKISLAARDPSDLDALCTELDGQAFALDAGDLESVERLFADLDEAPDVVLYNPSARAPGAIQDIDARAVARAIQTTAIGGFFVAQQAAKTMLPNKHGAILFTGATASVKAYSGSTAFAMGKYALRALAESLARELHPKGIHIGHFIIDGGIENPDRPGRGPDPAKPDRWLHPDAIAEAYWQHLCQDRSIWSWESALRPWVEVF